MSNPQAPFLIRIFRQDGAILGAGFLVSERYALTCAHVVADALGIDAHAPDKPTAAIQFDFPLVVPGQKLAAKVAHWLPLRSQTHQQPAGDEDIALLEMPDELPRECRPAPFAKAEVAPGAAFQTYGFPAGYDRGVPAGGRTKGAIVGGCVVIEDTKGFGYFVAPGFSGAPVWSHDAVIGMIVSADKSQRAAYLIPSSLLWQDVVAPACTAPPNKRYKTTPRPFLPYLCDRSEQEDKLREALELHRSRPLRRPLLCVISGDEFECHDKFIERLTDDLLPNLLGQGSPLENLYWHEPAPPTVTVEQFWLNFGNRILSLSTKSVEECRTRFQQMLRTATAPLFVNVGWLTENCGGGSQERFASFLEFLADWQALLPANRLVICALSLTYQRSQEAASRFRFWRKSPNQSLREFLPTLATKASDKLSVVVLPELRAITRKQAEDWPKHPKVRSNYLIPKEEITKLYRDNEDRPIEMENLAPKLRQLING
jgi:hypothetical protein